MRKVVQRIIVASLIAVVSACSTPKAPPPKVTVKPVEVTPSRPTPPNGASPLFAVPALDAAGARQTVSLGISDQQRVWNLRSAYNVAALNCMRPQDGPILVGYRQFLKDHHRSLGTVNTALDRDFRSRYGSNATRRRETYNTQVYNFYALPPTLNAFCDAVLGMSTEAMTLKSSDLAPFSLRHVAIMDQVFEQFFQSYERYKYDLSVWEAKYGGQAVAHAGTVHPAQP